jgi:predicted DCC family thiol-disulfide oxidoreductase YuxK
MNDDATPSDIRSPEELLQDGPVVLFDGVCNLCNSTVQFLSDRDRAGRLRYASLQGEAGQGLLRHFGLATADFDTFVLAETEGFRTRSTAAIRTLSLLGGPWRMALALLVVPAFIRDAVYSWVARNRYRWFGREESCRLPSPGMAARFLDS